MPLQIFHISRQHTQRFFNRLFHKSIFLLSILSAVMIGLEGRPLFCIPAFAEDSVTEANPDIPWQITADTLDYIENQYTLKGNVIIERNGHTLTADIVYFNPKTMMASASGNVTLTSGEDVLTGSQMELDLSTETGMIMDGNLFYKKEQFHITGKSIQKISKTSYVAKDVTSTTCSGTCPAWKITGRDLSVTVEGYARVNHAVFWIKDIPLFYSPFLIFPVKSERQSGFLSPRVDHSNRLGFSYDQPFFWAINKHSDATLYTQYMSERGLKWGMEYRYVLDKQTRGTLIIDMLNDRKRDDGRNSSSEDWGYEDDNVLRTNTDRYWVRMKHNHALPRDIYVELDLDIVSDQDYLHEFREGYTGYLETADTYKDQFKRVLDGYDDPVRVNRLNIRKSWDIYSLNSELRWYGDVIQRRGNQEDTTLHKLPFIEFDSLKQTLFDTPIFVDVNTGYTHFYRETGPRGHRLDAQTRLYYPFWLQNKFTFEPSIGLRETLWHLDKDEIGSQEKDRTHTRETYDIRVDLSTSIDRIFSHNLAGDRQTKHLILPRLTYQYQPDQNQEDYPFFDAIDRIAGSHRITYSVTNILISKSPTDKNDTSPETSGRDSRISAPPFEYRQYLRFMIEQSYDIETAESDNSEPFSPVYTRFEYVPKKYIAMDVEMEWSPYDEGFIAGNTVISFFSNREDRLFIEYRYVKDIMETISGNFDINLTHSVSAYGNYEHNIHNQKEIRHGLGIIYRAQCWSVDLWYMKEESDQRVGFMVDFLGIGQFGG